MTDDRRPSWRISQAEAVQMDILPGWYATRARRRRLAALGAVAVALLWVDVVPAWTAERDDTPWPFFALLGISTVLALPTISLLNVATRGVTALAEKQLDERQVAERLRATALAHRVMHGVLASLAVALLTAGVLVPDEIDVPASAALMTLIALFMTNMMAPLLISAWRLPDPPPDDEDEDSRTVPGAAQRVGGKTAT
ncbi:hypothetical protein GCM10010466_55970 [Planomonospora alba]|uniref:Uncharacterized protein n=1 Tax=Planomonospora alba TaxID=161354 RepID=A0ABP6NTT0_9ACTN